MDEGQKIAILEEALRVQRKRLCEIQRRVSLTQWEGALGLIGVAMTEIDQVLWRPPIATEEKHK